jgi:ABC-type oligopeptide transport system substrate-binding subunit
VRLAADIAHFEVLHAIGYESYWALENIHSGLVWVDPQGNVIPDMATSWDSKDDGRTYIFHLHKGIQFHDGTPADAAAIKWNFEYILDPANTADARLFFRPIAAVEALDDPTLQIQLKEPSAGPHVKTMDAYRSLKSLQILQEVRNISKTHNQLQVKTSGNRFRSKLQRVKEWARSWKHKECLTTLWTTFYANYGDTSTRCAVPV